MMSKCLTIIVLLFSLWSLAAAQEAARRNVVVPLADGGFVAFKSETAWTGSGSARTDSVNQIPLGEFKAQALVDDNRVIHRVLADASGKYVFGYDLLIEAVPVSKTFTIAVAPLDPQIENKLLAEGSKVQPARIATLPQAGE